MLVCTKCKKPLKEIPLFNNGEDNLYAPSLPFCNNDKCDNFGLLTVVFKNEEEDKEGSDKKD